MNWVCRQDGVVWRDTIFNAGSVCKVEPVIGEGGKPLRWDYSGGWWHPEGLEVIKDSQRQIIPRHFEPEDVSEIVSKKCIVAARKGRVFLKSVFDKRLQRDVPVYDYVPARKWKFEHELVQQEIEASDEEITPVKASDFVKQKTAPQPILPRDAAKRR